MKDALSFCRELPVGVETLRNCNLPSAYLEGRVRPFQEVPPPSGALGCYRSATQFDGITAPARCLRSWTPLALLNGGVEALDGDGGDRSVDGV